jgi:hypothetical protein
MRQRYVSSTDIDLEPTPGADDQRIPLWYSASIRVLGKDRCQPGFCRLG